MLRRLKIWFLQLVQVFKKELYLSFHDIGVVIFFVVLGLVYPILYALCYNTETLRDVPVVIVDQSHSALSREFTRMLDATPEVRIASFAPSLDRAKVAMHEKEAYAIVVFPADFSHEVMRGKQAHVVFYMDMSVLMRYKQTLSAVTNVQQAMCAKLQGEKISAVGMNMSGGVIENRQVPMGNTGMGIASAILPAILVLVIQQSMLLGICMLRGGSRERRIFNGGIDPHEVKASVGATLWGKTLCYILVYTLTVIFALLITPIFFDFPQNGNPFEILLFMLPLLIASSFMGQSLQVLVNERESTFLVLVFTSVLFIFLSGVSWPRHAMSPLWIAVGNMIPSTWACNGYILMATDGASLNQVSQHYYMLWGLAAFYFVIAYLIERFVCRPRYQRMQYYAASDPDALRQEELRRNAADI